MLKLQVDNPEGLFLKYVIQKVKSRKDEETGEVKVELVDVDDDAEYLVLRVDEHSKDPEYLKACRIGAHAYADAVESKYPQLAADIRSKYPLL